jgi:hypothetical protein
MGDTMINTILGILVLLSPFGFTYLVIHLALRLRAKINNEKRYSVMAYLRGDDFRDHLEERNQLNKQMAANWPEWPEINFH